MKCPKRPATFVTMLTILLAAGLMTLPSSTLKTVASAAQASSVNEEPADVDIQILDSQPQRAVKVAILSSLHFDSTSVDPASVTFGGMSALRKQGGGVKVSVKDVNEDGHLDLILQFPPDVLNIGAGPTKVSLEALTHAGAGIRGVNCVQPSGEPCGGTIIPVIERNDGARRFKTQSVQAVTFSENFDGVTPPDLPTGWSQTTATDCVNSNPWATSNAGLPTPVADTAPNAAFVNSPNCLSDEYLQSPAIAISGSAATLTFRQNRSMETNFDGGVLEVSTDGGATFQDILAAGGSFATGGYNGTISTNFNNPIGGRQAWTGTSTVFLTTIVNFPASFAGHSVILRFRRATDVTTSRQGWRIDTISVDDVVADCVLTCPANITLSNDPNQCGAVVNYPSPTTTGTCSDVSCSPSSGSFFPIGSTSVTCTAGSTNCSFTVSIQDTQPPTIDCPANVSVGNDPGNCGAVVNYPTATVSDNCPGVVTNCNPPSGSFFPVGTSSVTCTATDAAGNSSSCTFSVAVQDTQPPTINCPANVLVGNDPGNCGAVVNYSPATASDNCPGVVANCNPPSGSFFPVGTTTVTCTATDAAGNSASCTFSVTVNDTEGPVISGASANPSSLWPANHKFVQVTVSYTSADTCAGATTCALSVTSNEPVDSTDDGDTAPDWIVVNDHIVKLRAERSGMGSGRIYTITITCTDASGNSSSTSVTVTVPLSQ